MIYPLLLASAFIDLSSQPAAFEYSIQSFGEDMETIFHTQSPFSEEFFPFVEGAIDILQFFTDSLDEEVKAKQQQLKTDFLNLQKDPALLDTVINDCKYLLEFPRLRFCDRFTAFERATEYLEERSSKLLSSLEYKDRVYIYGAILALNQIHNDLCDFICNFYQNEHWNEHFDFNDVEKLAFIFLLNPTLNSQYHLQLGLSVLKFKIHHL